jgi:hypothetical protein
MTSGPEGEDASTAAAGGQEAERSGVSLAIPPQTPLFFASNRSRYQRQELIAAIQARTGRKLISYVAETAALVRDDVVPLMDLLHRIPVGASIDFLLHTTGGDIDAADKIVRILRRRAGASGELRVVVPDYAKSAGTLIALGADIIVMRTRTDRPADRVARSGRQHFPVPRPRLRRRIRRAGPQDRRPVFVRRRAQNGCRANAAVQMRPSDAGSVPASAEAVTAARRGPAPARHA